MAGGLTGGKHRLWPPLILLLVLFTVSATAHLFVYYPVIVETRMQEPPILLVESNDASLVDTRLGVNKTNATINVTLTPTGTPYVIGLLHRSAVYWSDFDENPFETGDLYVYNPSSQCSWTWDPAGYVTLVATGTADSEGGECILALNRTITISPDIYVNYVFRIRYGFGFADTIFRTCPQGSPYYTVGAYDATDYGANDYIAIFLYDGSNWNLLNYVNNINIYKGVWYDMTARRNDDTGLLALASGTDWLLSASDTTVDVDCVGIGGYYDTGANFTVDFDLLLVTLGATPFYVNVTGLQPGWYVRILDNQGALLANATANGDTVSLEAWEWKFAENATIEVYDSSSMGTLLAQASFRWVVGGDLYLVSSAQEGVSVNLVNANNTGGETYYAGVRLVDYSVNGTFYNVTLWAAVGDQRTSRIEIIDGRLNSAPNTTSVPLPPGYQVRVYLYVNADPGGVMVLDLRLYYSIGGVIVEYPVNVTIRT